MLNQVKKISLAALILLIPAVLVLIIGWHWTASTDIRLRYFLYLSTQTITRPWGIVTTLVFMVWLMRGRKQIAADWVRIICLILVVVWGGQGLKSVFKNQFQEPRPYVVALMAENQQSGADFYRLTQGQRAELIQQRSVNWPTIPQWQRSHWQHETGYSFPSGHSMFVSCWVMLFYGLLSLKQRWGSLVIVTLWGWSVMWSRMALGMHWPQDVIASVIIAWMFTLFCLSCYYAYSRKILDKN